MINPHPHPYSRPIYSYTYTELTINEREDEIFRIVRASNLINEMFQNIGILVTEQHDLIGKIKMKHTPFKWIMFFIILGR